MREHLPPETTRKLRAALALTRAGLLAEQLLRAFWPVWSIVFLALAALRMDVPRVLPLEVVWIGLAVLAAAALGFAVVGARRFHWPTQVDAIARLDVSLPGRPLAALSDNQAIGTEDTAAVAVWRAHQSQMAQRVAQVRRVKPDLRLSSYDPFALRYSALLLLSVALVFGGAAELTLAPRTGAQAAPGPTAVWEGWIVPPAYTNLPSIYLNEVEAGDLPVSAGSQVTLRFYGADGAFTLDENISGLPLDLAGASDPQHDFKVAQSGRLSIKGTGGREWEIQMRADTPPAIEITEPLEVTAAGEMRQPYSARDDFGVVKGGARFVLDLDAVSRRYGLAADPDPRPDLRADLTLPLVGGTTDYTETLVEDFSQHPWSGLPVQMVLTVEDALGQRAETQPVAMVLPGRRFFQPLAGAVAEQRQALLWSRANAPSVAQILRAISHRPDGLFQSHTTYLRLRVIIRRLETFARFGLTPAHQEELAAALWDLAVQLEDGDLSDALERLRRAQDRVAEAIRNGASEAEIAQLMQEMRDAMQDYMRQLAQQMDQEDDEGERVADNSQMLSQEQLQDMLDRLQELMEQGRTAEAQELLQQLQQMTENMRMAEGQQGQPSPSEQARNGLNETLRQQQGLSDQAFRDLQEQFNPGGRAGENQGNEGRNGGQGRGQSHDPLPGEGQGQGGQPGQQASPGQSLGDQQQALREQLGRQQQALPGAGTESGDQARDALDRAGRAMEDAEQALRQQDLAGALDRQSEAIEALRDGMRALDQSGQQQQAGSGSQSRGAQALNGRDPLGRQQGEGGQMGTEQELLNGQDVYRRARDLLDELRRKSGETERPKDERRYFERLLDRF